MDRGPQHTRHFDVLKFFLLRVRIRIQNNEHYGIRSNNVFYELE